MSWTLAADVGGTFTDIILANSDGRYFAAKVLSSPPRFERSVLDGIHAVLERAGVRPDELESVLHGTTVATNSVLERTARPVALVTTEGFIDAVEIGRLRIPDSYDLHWRKPEPLAPRRYRVAVKERILADGSVATPLDPVEVVATLRPVASEVDAVAVSFLNSYANTAHEQAARDAIEAEFPDLAVTCGSEIVREIGEVERTSTAVLNAYLIPVMGQYLGELVRGLESLGTRAAPLILQSSGGMMPVTEAVLRPAAILESGPAAGVVASARMVAALGESRAVSFDMGGTTAKSSLIENGLPMVSATFTVGSDVSVMGRLTRSGGYPVQLPTIDLAEVGAGGSSLAIVDAAGAIRVGPESAGALPGPVCYGLGGSHVTVTDANLILGLISREGLAHNGIVADFAGALTAFQKQIAKPLGLDIEEAAFAVHQTANFQMARALRAVTTERGRTLSSYVLVAFGGSGPVHAATLAESVGISTILIPPHAGLFSAQGLVHSPIQLSASETALLSLADQTAASLAGIFQELRDQLVTRFIKAGWDAGDARAEYAVEARYHGQSSTLRVPLAEPHADPADLAMAFTSVHKETFGYSAESDIEIVSAHATVVMTDSSVALHPVGSGIFGADGHRDLYVGGETVSAPVLRRAGLVSRTPGPCVLDEPDTSVFVPPGWTVSLDAMDNLRLERSESE